MQQRLGTALDRVLNSATVPRSTTAPSFNESPDIKVGLSSANRHNLRGVSSPSVIE